MSSKRVQKQLEQSLPDIEQVNTTSPRKETKRVGRDRKLVPQKAAPLTDKTRDGNARVSSRSKPTTKSAMLAVPFRTSVDSWNILEVLPSAEKTTWGKEEAPRRTSRRSTLIGIGKRTVVPGSPARASAVTHTDR